MVWSPRGQDPTQQEQLWDPTSPSSVPRENKELRLSGQRCGKLCSLKELSIIPLAEGFPLEQWFYSHWGIFNCALNLKLHGGPEQAVQRPSPNHRFKPALIDKRFGFVC